MKERNRKNKRVSIVDVAQAAGVSQATAARVFDPKWEDRIRPETRRAVEQAAAALGYRGTNALARSIQGGASGIVALVLGASTGYFYLEVIMKFVRRLRESGKQVLIFEADPEKDLSEIVTQIRCYQVDAIIITAAATSSTIIHEFCGADIPVVVFNRPVEDGICSAVYCDGFAASEQAAKYLMGRGHRTFMVISGDGNLSKELGRVEGFCSYVNRAGGSILEIADGDYLYESGYEIAKRLLKDRRPDAVYCVEDSIAMGAIDAARECYGLRVPEDLSVMGFDNTSVGRFRAYDLTTVEHPVSDLIEGTIEIMEAMLRDPSARICRSYHMRIVERGSVAARFAR